jgi:hypothetical protein
LTDTIGSGHGVLLSLCLLFLVVCLVLTCWLSDKCIQR